MSKINKKRVPMHGELRCDCALFRVHMSDVDIEIKELNDRVAAQDKIINFLVQCGDAKSAELRHLREKIRSSPFVQ